jgi:hypothetical protein
MNQQYPPTEKLNMRLQIFQYLKINENKDPGDRFDDSILRLFNKINVRKNITGSGAVGTMTFKYLRNKINTTSQNIINKVLELDKLDEKEIDDIIIKEKNEIMKKKNEQKVEEEKMQDDVIKLYNLVSTNYTHGNSNLKTDSTELKLYNI